MFAETRCNIMEEGETQQACRAKCLHHSTLAYKRHGISQALSYSQISDGRLSHNSSVAVCRVRLMMLFSLSHDSSVAACRVRLVMLFSLRYEREGRAQTSDLLQRMQETGVARQLLGLVRTLLLNCGQEKRVGDLFSDMTFSSRFATLAKQNLKVCIAAKAYLLLL